MQMVPLKWTDQQPTGILASAVTKKQNTLPCLAPAQICDIGFSTGAYIKTLTEPEKTNDE